MRAIELIDILKSFDPNTEIVLSSDEEGNYFERLYTFSEELWDPKSKELYNTDEDDQEELKENGAKEVLVLWP